MKEQFFVLCRGEIKYFDKFVTAQEYTFQTNYRENIPGNELSIMPKVYQLKNKKYIEIDPITFSETEVSTGKINALKKLMGIELS